MDERGAAGETRPNERTPGRARRIRIAVALVTVVVLVGGFLIVRSLQQAADGYQAVGDALGQGIATGAHNAGSSLAGIPDAFDRLGRLGQDEAGLPSDPSTPAATLRNTALTPQPDGRTRACSEVTLSGGHTLNPSEWAAGAIPAQRRIDTPTPPMQAVALVEPLGASTGRVCVDVPPGAALIQWTPEPNKSRAWVILTTPPTTR